ncbi:MAG: branched-chain amino acid ABC transporter permease [Armatimonadota bacterium]|nr:branched-chain amino acid ABC transporter permease [bacterium]
MMAKYPRSKPLWKLYIGPMIMALAVAAFPMIARGDYSYLLDLGRLCGIYVIIVCGLTLLMGYTGQISLGHAGFYALGAYIPAVLISAFHWPLWAAVIGGILGTAVISLLIGSSILRLQGNHLALATLAVGIIIGEGVSKLAITGGADGLFGLPQITLFGLLTRPEVRVLGIKISQGVLQLYFIWAVVVACIVWAVQLIESPGGRSLRAIHGDEQAAESLGINTFALKVKVFVASCVLAAIAGVLFAFVHAEGNLLPEEFGLMMNVQLVMMVVIGGMGSIWGSVAGGVILTVLHEVIALIGSAAGAADTSRIEHLIFGVMLALILILSPSGLIPGLKRATTRIIELRSK